MNDGSGSAPAKRPRSIRPLAGPASYRGPTCSALRANPSPEVTDLACRFPLPTLFYQLEAEHLGDLLRIRVRSGTGATLRLPPIFTGLSLRSGRRESRAALRVQHPYLPANRFQGVRPSQRKENSSRDSDRRLDGRFRCRSVLPRGPAAGRSPIPGSGILTGFPFAEKAWGYV